MSGWDGSIGLGGGRDRRNLRREVAKRGAVFRDEFELQRCQATLDPLCLGERLELLDGQGGRDPFDDALL